MNTVLFFVYSNKYICANRINGARRYAERRGWNIQVVERNNLDKPLDIKGIVKFWKPMGIIAECAGGMPEVSRATVGEIPLVYLDEDPNGGKGNALYVNSDSRAVGEVAPRSCCLLTCRTMPSSDGRSLAFGARYGARRFSRPFACTARTARCSNARQTQATQSA